MGSWEVMENHQEEGRDVCSALDNPGPRLVSALRNLQIQGGTHECPHCIPRTFNMLLCKGWLLGFVHQGSSVWLPFLSALPACAQTPLRTHHLCRQRVGCDAGA